MSDEVVEVVVLELFKTFITPFIVDEADALANESPMYPIIVKLYVPEAWLVGIPLIALSFGTTYSKEIPGGRLYDSKLTSVVEQFPVV